MISDTKWAICNTCDLNCAVLVTVQDGKVKAIKRNPDHPVTPNSICVKAACAHEYISHPDRLLYPLKRDGERGSGRWTRITWKQALDEIAETLKGLMGKFGPETVASSFGWSTNAGAASRRFMNLLGSPNWTWPGYVCLSNTTVTSKITYGWWQFPDYAHTRCIVLLGHDPNPDKWTAEYLWIRDALKNGAKLIVVDPRRNDHSHQADIWLRIRPGTDGALLLGWLNVIIKERLYNKEFVEKWTVGFDALAERMKEFPPERVAEITWASADKIREAARMYATNGPAVIPWTVVTDHHANSTHALRCQAILRAICGNLDVPGGELLMGYHPTIISETEIELNERLPSEQRKKQLGVNRYKLLSWETFEKTSLAMEKVWGKKYSNQVSGGAMAHPPSVWRAMIEGKPYPVKALLVQSNNTLLSYPNADRIHKALRSLDLLVVMDLMMTPTAQLADYVLPATHWLERPNLFSYWDWVAIYEAGEKAVDPPCECMHDWMFWRELGVRMGQENDWPWKTMEEFYDYRLAPEGTTWQEFSTRTRVSAPELAFKKYEQTGFGTPSRKVEIYSSILEDLNYDPLPNWHEPPDSPVSTPELAKDYPLIYFTGLRDKYWFHTFGLGRSVTSLRHCEPDPRLEIHPDTAHDLGLLDGDWAWVETPSKKKIKLRVWVSADAHPSVVRVPHGWWFPEKEAGEPGLSGLWDSADSVILPDDDRYCDTEQGCSALRGLLCKVYKAEDASTK